MHEIKSFSVIGGDLRHAHLANLLYRDGYKVYAVGFDKEVQLEEGIIKIGSASAAVKQSDAVVLPLPTTIDGNTVNAPFGKSPIPFSEIIGSIKPHQPVLGGRISGAVRALTEANDIRIVDYLEREELAVLNAIPTAEGAVEIAMQELPITLHDSKCLVLGYGRVGKVLSKYLKALEAHVTVSARKCADLAWVATDGLTAVHIDDLAGVVGECDVIFNTIPAMVLDAELLSKIKSDCLLVDLASKPGGVDFKTAGHLGIKTIWALSLPGKVAPITAGAIIKQTIINILTEEASEWERSE